MENLERKHDTSYEPLAELGFSPQGVEKIVHTLSYIPEETSVESKITLLKKAGFTDPVDLIEKNPSILTQAEDAMVAKINWITQQDFSDSIHLLEKAPTIFNYGLNSMEHKITWLADEGFSHPIQLIERMPTILGLAQESLKKKIEYIQESLLVLGDYSPEEAKNLTIKYIEYTPSLLGTKFDKLVVLIRIFTLLKNPNELPTEHEVNKLSIMNLEDVLLALDKMKDNQNISFSTFIAEVQKIKEGEFEKTDKQKRILNTITNLESEDDTVHQDLLKVLKRYKRGYLDK